LEDIFLVIVFLENLFFTILGVIGTESQETKSFFGARKLARLLVGWVVNSIVPLRESRKGSGRK
jgi:hypothetical protein